MQAPEHTSDVPSRVDAHLRARGADLEASVAAALREGTEFLFATQFDDHRWCAELESNPTITAEYVFLQHILGRDLAAKSQAIVRYLVGLQKRDGSWGLARNSVGDVSTTAETYLALKLLGVADEHPAQRSAQEYILCHGGLATMRIFTRIFFAMFGLFPWDAVPVVPPELALLPAAGPINVFRLASWARGTMIPLFIVCHHRPVYALPNGRSDSNDWLDHLWLDPTNKHVPYLAPWLQIVRKHGLGARALFAATDGLLRAWHNRPIAAVRRRALERCTQYVLERQESTGDWGGIFPPMFNGVLALVLQGYALDSAPVAKGLEAIENFAWQDGDGFRVQACVSPVWDTVLATIGLVDAGVPRHDARLAGAVDWIVARQILEDRGDWKVYRPDLAPGGWSFEYANTWYPDVDDTAAVILGLLKQDPACVVGEPMRRAVRWVLGMQNRDGGWGAFDVDNDRTYLNDIPFSDMDSLCDPSTPDVSGRVLEAFGLYIETLDRAGVTSGPDEALRREVQTANLRGLAYMRASQEPEGSWFGRWGVNYVYGTSNALCGLARLRVPGSDPMIVKALAWLERVQNADGGWGERLESYADRTQMGQGASTASQTAWGLMGLLAYRRARDASVERGAAWLVTHQVPARAIHALESGRPVPVASGRTWDEEEATGTGFPNHFYLRYHLYRHYFPMMALGRFAQARGSRA